MFSYDALDRLEDVERNAASIFAVSYDALGNILTKTGVTGTYAYGAGPAGPHAVTSIGSMTFGYDANGNMTSRDGQTIGWTSFNKPDHIEEASGDQADFTYGPDRGRWIQTAQEGSWAYTRHYVGAFEVLKWGASDRVDTHYIFAGDRAVAQWTTSNVQADALQYLHRDHQGSVVAATDATGDVLAELEYDPFGVQTLISGSPDDVTRGYTGHEHLESVALIHMNGRVQDPLLGRFLSPDPFVQAPYYSQSLNRYSYVWNNPMTLVDPSGYGTDLDDPYSDPNNACFWYDGCLTLERYRELEEWDNRTQYLASLGNRPGVPILPVPGNPCPLGCHTSNEPYSSTANVPNGGVHGSPDPDGFGYRFGVFVDAWRYHWKDILRGSTQGARQYPTGDFWADVSGVDAGIEAIVEASEGDYTDASIEAAGSFLGKVRIAGRAIPLVANPRLRNAIGMLFKSTDKLPGGTAGAIRYTRITGELVGGSDHIIAGTERARYLEKILKNENLNASDRSVAEALLQDLRDALAGK